jgi:hypothetical protein
MENGSQRTPIPRHLKAKYRIFAVQTGEDVGSEKAAGTLLLKLFCRRIRGIFD